MCKLDHTQHCPMRSLLSQCHFCCGEKNNLEKKPLRGGRVYLTYNAKLQSIFGGKSRQNLVATYLHTHTRGKKEVNTCMLICVELNFSSLTQCRSTYIRNGIAHSGLVPASMNLIKIISQGKYTGQCMKIAPQRDSFPGDYRLCLVRIEVKRLINTNCILMGTSF